MFKNLNTSLRMNFTSNLSLQNAFHWFDLEMPPKGVKTCICETLNSWILVKTIWRKKIAVIAFYSTFPHCALLKSWFDEIYFWWETISPFSTLCLSECSERESKISLILFTTYEFFCLTTTVCKLREFILTLFWQKNLAREQISRFSTTLTSMIFDKNSVKVKRTFYLIFLEKFREND